MIYIDVTSNEVYLLEPNGKPSFFNNLMNYDIGKKLETMITNYFNELNIFGTNFKYISVNNWNQKNIHLNKDFDNHLIGTGHCAILSLLLAHLAMNINMKPKDIYDLLGNLSDEEILFIIKEYSCGIYHLLKNNKKLYHEDKYINKFKKIKLLCPDIETENINDYLEILKKNKIDLDDITIDFSDNNINTNINTSLSDKDNKQKLQDELNLSNKYGQNFIDVEI